MLRECPITDLRDETQAAKLARSAVEASPTNGAYAVCLAHCLSSQDAEQSLKWLAALESRPLEQTARYHLARAACLPDNAESIAAAKAWYEKHQPHHELTRTLFK